MSLPPPPQQNHSFRVQGTLLRIFYGQNQSGQTGEGGHTDVFSVSQSGPRATSSGPRGDTLKKITF